MLLSRQNRYTDLIACDTTFVSCIILTLILLVFMMSFFQHLLFLSKQFFQSSLKGVQIIIVSILFSRDRSIVVTVGILIGEILKPFLSLPVGHLRIGQIWADSFFHLSDLMQYMIGFSHQIMRYEPCSSRWLGRILKF